MATNLEHFQQQLGAAKTDIDQVIAEYIHQQRQSIGQNFDDYSVEAFEAFAAILGRGGKRIRGALAMEAYRMFGGTDRQVALQAALVMELVQAYLLVTDDVCDRSQVRRGGPTAHMLLAEQHRQKGWQDDPDHFGQSIAVLSAMLGLHQALTLVGNLEVGADIRVAALNNLNRCIATTIHGQFTDMYLPVTQSQDLESVEDVLVWKTAFYTFVSPMQFGAILADADQAAIESLVDIGVPLGRVFQLSDDLIGVFVEGEQSGKNPLDDIREGKRTVQVVKALSLADDDDRQFLESMLGNQELDRDQLERCRQIIRDSGAYQYVQDQIAANLVTARQLIESSAGMDQSGQAFLLGLADYLEHRQS